MFNKLNVCFNVIREYGHDCMKGLNSYAENCVESAYTGKLPNHLQKGY